MQVADTYRAKMHFATDQAVMGNWRVFVGTMVDAAVEAGEGQYLKAALLQVRIFRLILTTTYGSSVLRGPYINGLNGRIQ